MVRESNTKPNCLFITFEGIEGSGKSTQVRMLAERLERYGYSFILTKEPGGTKLGEQIREMLLSWQTHMNKVCELLLFLADRAQHVEEVILPALKEGKLVICERYCDSTLAYQHYGLGLPLELINMLNDLATQSLKPHVTFLLDIEPALGLRRLRGLKSSLDRIEQRPISFHERVREGYLEIARNEPERVVVLDASLPAEDVAAMVWEKLSCLLQKKDMRR
jgi:dTMP kinase